MLVYNNSHPMKLNRFIRDCTNFPVVKIAIEHLGAPDCSCAMRPVGMEESRAGVEEDLWAPVQLAPVPPGIAAVFQGTLKSYHLLSCFVDAPCQLLVVL